MQYVQLRNGKYQYYRRVPTEVAHLDRRPFVKISLKTDSEEIAKKRVVLVNQAAESYWQDLAQHDQGDTQHRYEAAVRHARTFGSPTSKLKILRWATWVNWCLGLRLLGIRGWERQWSKPCSAEPSPLS